MTIVLITLLIGASAGAQTVFKCTVEGKTTYQSQACTTGGKALQVDPGPSAAEIQEAQQRATKEKNDASAAGAAAIRRETQPTAGPTNSLRNGASSNCATLNQQHADAWGRRNAFIRSKSLNPNDAKSLGTISDVEAAQRNLQRNGCPIQ
jgi:hypothetical protein